VKFTLPWLKEHLDTDASLPAIVDKLTMIGLEVERVEDRASLLKPFVIASVISAEKHPNADRLHVCMVDIGQVAKGDKPIQVVCGAPNARAGLKGVFGVPGTFIPGKNMTLEVGKIRGVESRGMLMSEAELQISDDHDGIIDLPADAPVGKSYIEWAGAAEPVIEINLTPNRPDCTGVNGIARDLGAAGIGTFKDRPPKPVKGKFPCPVKVTIKNPELCPAFGLRLVRGVKNGPSPDWLQKRLAAIGLRPINALVDITNFITYDRGRPLHVFDAAKVHGHLTVRRAKAGETLLALDGKTYTLDDSVCVIADEKAVESLSGIMGGEASGCDENTTDVLIESALWDELNIAQSGRRLAINSDARYRFERGVDPKFMRPGLELATQMVMQLCGGTPSTVEIAGKVKARKKPIDFPTGELKRLTGLTLQFTKARRVLENLGFDIEENDVPNKDKNKRKGKGKRITDKKECVKITVPSWRPDIEGKADIVEEIVRIVGVDRVPSTPFPRGEDARKPVLTAIQNRTRKAKRALAARGLVEAVTWSFVSKREAELFGGGKAELALANPIAAELSDMRPSLIPGLVMAAQKNADRGNADVALFEVGQIFKGDKPEDQLTAACGLRRALAKASGIGRHWSGAAKPVDAFDAKADAFAVLAAAGAPMQALQVMPGGPAWFHPGRSGTIQIGPQNVLGAFGELHPRALEALKAEGPLVAFEVILEKIPEPKAKPTRAKPLLELSPFQPVERDFAFVVENSVKAADIVRAAQNVDRKLIVNVTVFDVYEGKGIEPGKKSIAIAVTMQPREKTMTDAEIDALAAKIVAEVGKRTGGVLRT
jgi:phenylalanyl-tRNA synthetase beta chain